MVVYAGVFETEDKARAAHSKLTEAGYETDDLFMITPAEGVAKVKSTVASGLNTEFQGIKNRMISAIEAGHTLLGARPRLFFSQMVVDTFDEVGAADVLTYSWSAPRFLSQVIGLPLVFRSRPRVNLWKRPVTEMLGKTMIYKRPVTETLGKKMLLESKPITEKLGKTMLYKRPVTETLGKPMIISEIKKRRD